MTLTANGFEEELDRYTRKCRQQLDRTIVFHRLVLDSPATPEAVESSGFKADQLFDQPEDFVKRFERSSREGTAFLLFRSWTQATRGLR
jgi:hypothetical protein